MAESAYALASNDDEDTDPETFALSSVFEGIIGKLMATADRWGKGNVTLESYKCGVVSSVIAIPSATRFHLYTSHIINHASALHELVLVALPVSHTCVCILGSDIFVVIVFLAYLY